MKSPKKFVEKKNFKKKIFCETEKLDYPRFLGDFYYHGTMNLPCIREPTSIRNWVTFCDQNIKCNFIKSLPPLFAVY